MKWRTSLVAWANDAGVKVYDTANDQRITFIERPRNSPRPELLPPHLVWQVSRHACMLLSLVILTGGVYSYGSIEGLF